MAVRKKAAAKKAAPRRRRIMAAAPRRSTRRSSRGTSSKFDFMNSIIMPAAGAGIAIVAGNAIGRMIPQLPFGKAIIPFGLAFVSGSMLRQPALAAGMAAAGGIALLNQVSPAMFADESLEFLNEDPVPMIDFSDDMEMDYDGGNFEALQQYNDADTMGGTIKYDSNNNPLIELPDGSLQYI